MKKKIEYLIILLKIVKASGSPEEAVRNLKSLLKDQPKAVNKLTIGSFKREGEVGSFDHYFTHTTKDGIEVCLESCLNGYDVALYRNKELVVKKFCTNLEGMLESQITPGFSTLSGEALEKAVKVANRMLTKRPNIKSDNTV